jgi:hypothetical protein
MTWKSVAELRAEPHHLQPDADNFSILERGSTLRLSTGMSKSLLENLLSSMLKSRIVLK